METTIICYAHGKYSWAKNYPSKQIAVAFLADNQELSAVEIAALESDNTIKSGLSVFTLEEVR